MRRVRSKGRDQAELEPSDVVDLTIGGEADLNAEALDQTDIGDKSGTIGDAVVDENENGSSGSVDGRPSARSDIPSYAPTDPEWVTEDFSSLDLGEDVDSSAKPVRRLELPPLAEAAVGNSELSSSTSGPGGNDSSPANEEANDLGVFGVGNNAGDVAEEALMNGNERRRPDAGHNPIGSSQMAGARLSSEAPAEPKQGVPPHPLSGGGSDMAGLSDDRNQLHSVPPTSAGPVGPNDDPFAGYDANDRAFEEQFSHDDALSHQLRADRGGRAALELAAPLSVEQRKRNWLLPALGLLAVLGLAGGYFLFLRDSGDSADTFAADEADLAGDLVEDDLEPEGTTTDATDGAAATPAVTELSDSPVLSLAGAVDGPLEIDVEYELSIEGVPDGASYLVVVDDLRQEPVLDYLPVLILPEGRHTLSVEVTAGAKTAMTNNVDVYVLTPNLQATHRANLSSVSIVDEGWAEALRQFDEFRSSGHDSLMLSPSDPYPSLLPGFWNLYVPGLANHAEAQSYCEGADMIIPDDCFPAPFDPNGPPRDS